jgi:hypothetical protein
MQIHEITRSSLQEGILGDIGRGVFQGATGMEIPQGQASINKDAASAAAKLQAQGYGPAGTAPPGKKSPVPSADWKDKLAQAKKDPAVKQYISQLAQGWAQEAKKVPAPTAPATATPNQRTNVVPIKANPGQMSAAVAASKAGQDLQKMFGQPRGGIQDMKSDLEEAPLGNLGQRAAAARAARTAQRNPGAGPANNANTAQVDPYQTAFVRWSDAQLASKDPVTYQAITMQDVRALPGLAAELDRALQAVVSARDTPQSAAAIAQYLELAVAGVQARSQQLKNKAPEVAINALSNAQANLGSVQQTLSKVGVNPRALSAFGSKAKSKNVVTTGNDEADALLKQAGFSL